MTHQENYNLSTSIIEDLEALCLKLISARLMDISEEWQIGKRYCAGKSFDC